MERFEFPFLLFTFKRQLELWFHSDCRKNGKNAFCEMLLEPISAIILHRLRILNNEFSTNSDSFQIRSDVKVDFAKFKEGFEFITKSATLHDSFMFEMAEINHLPSVTLNSSTTTKAISVQQFLRLWILYNFQLNCLCSALEYLIADNELLSQYYEENAFLRNNDYAAAFLIGLSALELNQFSLISQINDELYAAHRQGVVLTSPCEQHNVAIRVASRHKRNSSHPNFSLCPPIQNSLDKVDGTSNDCNATKIDESYIYDYLPQNNKAATVFRRVKSLPLLLQRSCDMATCGEVKMRKRSKTLNANAKILRVSTKRTCSINIVKTSKNAITDTRPLNINELSFARSTSSCSVDCSRRSDTKTTIESTSKPIEIINCEGIKIWTESDADHETISVSSLLAPVPKSVSPINSFLSSFINTPPTYSNWYFKSVQAAEADDTTSTASSGHYPCNTRVYFDNSACGMGFLPIYGTKLESRQNQSIFEDGISTLDYSASTSNSIAMPSLVPVDVSTKSSDNNSKESCMNSKLNTLKTNLVEKDNVLPNQKEPNKNTLKNSTSLTTFLQSKQISRNDTDLEKENAHFRISEAIITAIEHLKCRKQSYQTSSDINVTATATDWLANNRSHGMDALNEESVPYVFERDECQEELSAEVVGLSLISKFNEKHMPKISELKCLVSEEDAPQELLPMPNTTMPSLTRGTRSWAPPRQQIIFTDHPSPNRKDVINKQNHRCAGCGMHIHTQYLNSFRYCTYLGKYFCTGCHRNQVSVIPAKILQMWDFKCYPVSMFAYRLLEQMYTFPLFHVPDLNAALYVKSKVLASARNKRLQLKYIKDFIMSCRSAVREQKYFNAIPEHITNDVDFWSTSDFVDTYNESMHRSIDDLVLKCENHIKHCFLCNGRGFICEYCQRDQIIFPWCNKKVFRCDRCGSCFHLSCWKSMSELCSRCQRMNRRQDEISDLEISVEQQNLNISNNNLNNRNSSIDNYTTDQNIPYK